MNFGQYIFGGQDNYKPDPNAARLAGAPQLRGAAQGYLGGVDRRRTPQAAEDGVFRNAQLQTMGQLQGVASGQQQGAGELAVQRAIGRALANQQAMASQTRGGNAAFAAREAARNAASLGVQGAGQAGMARMQDQQNAQGLLAQVASQGRQADQNLSLANMNAALQARGMDDQQRVALLSQLYGISAAELQARMQMEMARAQAGKSKGIFGDLLQAGGTMGADWLGQPSQPAPTGGQG